MIPEFGQLNNRDRTILLKAIRSQEGGLAVEFRDDRSQFFCIVSGLDYNFLREVMNRFSFAKDLYIQNPTNR